MGRNLVFVGVILALLGLVGLAIPVFTTEQTRDVAKLGDLKVQTTDETSYRIPPLVSGGALAIGVLLMGFAIYQRR